MTKFSKPFLSSIGLLAMLCGVAASAAAGGLPEEQHSGSSSFVTGGIGLDESTAFKSAMKDWPLSMLFAQKQGARAEYVADVQLAVTDRKGNTAFETVSQGPFVLAKLQPGSYQVAATLDNKTLHQTVEIKPGKPARIVFLWPAQPGGKQ